MFLVRHQDFLVIYICLDHLFHMAGNLHNDMVDSGVYLVPFCGGFA